MKNTAALVLGLLLGWLIEWIIDWFYWRRRVDPRAKLKERITELEEEQPQRVEIPRKAMIRDAKGNDNLQAIYGIGPVFARRLDEAGVRTFEELARLTPKEMEEILGSLFKRLFSEENTILAQARELAEQKAQQR